ncbi:MAG TPA: ACT domain-containing protein [Marmoricola sp.]|jgi:glycine cleavage system transcriptional repressor|nr:ACT domain-containing protein [Marmoricola sp.]
MPLLAITVLGHDRPGIIAGTTGVLADLGLNIEDSTMTLLRGHFAMMLISEGSTDASTVEEALGGLTVDGTLSVSVREVPAEQAPSRGTAYLLSVHGGDRPGIVSTMIGRIADAGGNVTDLTTRLAGDLYVLLAEVDLPASADPDALARALAGAGAAVGVEVTLRALESDDL